MMEKKMRKFILLIIMVMFVASTTYAASCPYCGQEYGEPAPGDEKRVYALRREHETTCSARTSKPTEPSWVGQSIQATGRGAIDTNRFPNREQAELVALRYAIRDAQRNLLKQVLPLKLDSKTTVRDVVPKSLAEKAYSSPLIYGYSRTSTHYGVSTCTVKMELKLRSPYNYLKVMGVIE